ncbi:hypothetical protein Tco_0743149 [Tanacetum coccineum]
MTSSNALLMSSRAIRCQKQDPSVNSLTKIPLINQLVVASLVDSLDGSLFVKIALILNSQNEFFNSQNEQFNSGCEHLNTQITTLHDLIAQAMQKKEEEKRIAEEQAAKERYWKIPHL